MEQMDIELMAEFGQNVQQVLIITLRVVRRVVAHHFELCFMTFRPPLPSIFFFLVIINKNLNFALSLSRYCVLHPGAIKVFLSSCLHTISKKD